MSECIFCKISKGEIAVNKIYENDSFFSILDKDQKIKGHALIISKRHFENTLEMPSIQGSQLMDAVKNTSIRILKKEKASGFNLLSNNFEDAGQVVKHVHFHILPRKKGDGIRILS